MSINRRGFLYGIIAAGMAPAIVKAGVLMPVRKIIVPDQIIKVRRFAHIPGGVRFEDITTTFDEYQASYRAAYEEAVRCGTGVLETFLRQDSVLSQRAIVSNQIWRA